MQVKNTKLPNFYLKINFHHKNKKFIVRNLKQINLEQIKQSFGSNVSSNIRIAIFQCGQQIGVVRTQQQLISKISVLKIPQKSQIKLQFIEQSFFKKPNIVDIKQQDQQDVPSAVKKMRSRSQQIELNSKTQILVIQNESLEVTEQFLYRSLVANKLQQAENILQQTNRRLQRIKSSKRQTNINSLLKFLSDD